MLIFLMEGTAASKVTPQPAVSSEFVGVSRRLAAGKRIYDMGLTATSLGCLET